MATFSQDSNGGASNPGGEQWLNPTRHQLDVALDDIIAPPPLQSGDQVISAPSNASCDAEDSNDILFVRIPAGAGGLNVVDKPFNLPKAYRQVVVVANDGGTVQSWLSFSPASIQVPATALAFSQTTNNNIIPLGAPATPWRGIEFCKPIRNFYMSFDFSSGATAVLLAFSNDLKNLLAI